MPGKTPLTVLLVDDLAALLSMLVAVGATAAVLRLATRCHHAGRVVDLAQREAWTHCRYRTPARDHALDAADLDLTAAD
jgi:hypothetical protein